MRFRDGKQECRLEFTDALPRNDYGSCSPPHVKCRVIRIRKSMNEKLTLETICHELLHLTDWDLDEAAVERRGKLLAKVLWRLGYRRK